MRSVLVALSALLVGCHGSLLGTAPATAPSSLAPTVQGLRVWVPRQVAVVTEGDVSPNLVEHLRAAVQIELQRAGLKVAADQGEPHDLVVKVETRVRGAVYFLHGTIGLTAEHQGVVVGMVSYGPALHKEAEFPGYGAQRAVDALLRSPTVVEFAQRRTTPATPVAAPAPPPPAPASPDPAAAEKAKLHAKQGTSFYNLGRYQEALDEYEAAYLAVAHPVLLFNIAQCHRKMGNDRQALAFYRTYLRTAPAAPNRDDVLRRIKELEAAEAKRR